MWVTGLLDRSYHHQDIHDIFLLSLFVYKKTCKVTIIYSWLTYSVRLIPERGTSCFISDSIDLVFKSEKNPLIILDSLEWRTHPLHPVTIDTSKQNTVEHLWYKLGKDEHFR
eukprot:TRINITY_DN10915_c0_g1_i1.p1 TRINITY_DN10915_c0_g1~~TRINITY_DN10915_c0_g1_i1.p1  ORF type:complete len:112 (+),score=1.33 TRINITY_DN10915_c0_g1_i1:127-462(+)